jgi:hypothetical protein
MDCSAEYRLGCHVPIVVVKPAVQIVGLLGKMDVGKP